MKKLMVGILLFCVTLFCGIGTGIAQNENATSPTGDTDKLRESLTNYSEDPNPENANGLFSDLLKNPDEVDGKKVVGKFYVKLKLYTDPNDLNNYTAEPIDEDSKPTYHSRQSSNRYFQLFEGHNDKKTYRNLVVGSTVTLYVLVLGGALPFDEKHTLTKLYFLSKIK